MKIGQKIQFAREFRELDRTSFAKLIGVKYRDILRWETTSHEPRAATLKKMADVLKIDMDYFFDENDGPSVIVSYLSEDEMWQETGLGEILTQKREQIKKCVDNISNDNVLSTTCRLMMDYVDPKMLRYLLDVVLELTHYTGSVPDKFNTTDEKRLFIKQMISESDDPAVLRTIARILASFTRNADVTNQLDIVMHLSNSFPSVVMPGDKKE